jgi:hypothetical protein
MQWCGRTIAVRKMRSRAGAGSPHQFIIAVASKGGGQCQNRLPKIE